MKLCEVAFQSLNVTLFSVRREGEERGGRGGDQHWLSNQCSGEQRILASTTPRGGNQCSSCFHVDLSPGWHVLFFSATHSEANRLIWAISAGRRGSSHLNRVAWTRLMVARLPAHSGQLVIAVRGAIVDFLAILFHPRTNQPFSECALLNFIYPLEKGAEAKGTRCIKRAGLS